jgi:hypothetical protein
MYFQVLIENFQSSPLLKFSSTFRLAGQFVTSFSGNGGAKFSKKVNFFFENRPFQRWAQILISEVLSAGGRGRARRQVVGRRSAKPKNIWCPFPYLAEESSVTRSRGGSFVRQPPALFSIGFGILL